MAWFQKPKDPPPIPPGPSDRALTEGAWFAAKLDYLSLQATESRLLYINTHAGSEETNAFLSNGAIHSLELRIGSLEKMLIERQLPNKELSQCKAAIEEAHSLKTFAYALQRGDYKGDDYELRRRLNRLGFNYWQDAISVWRDLVLSHIDNAVARGDFALVQEYFQRYTHSHKFEKTRHALDWWILDTMPDYCPLDAMHVLKVYLVEGKAELNQACGRFELIDEAILQPDAIDKALLSSVPDRFSDKSREPFENAITDRFQIPSVSIEDFPIGERQVLTAGECPMHLVDDALFKWCSDLSAVYKLPQSHCQEALFKYIVLGLVTLDKSHGIWCVRDPRAFSIGCITSVLRSS